MAADLALHYWPNSVLVEPSEPIQEFGEEILALGNQMITLMTILEGVGLAAPQVGILKRMFVMTFQDGKNTDPQPPEIICNPSIVDESPQLKFASEGCLSLPGVSQQVARPTEIVLSYQTPFGDPKQMILLGREARVAQHEADHLDGIMFFDPKRMNRQLRKAVQAIWQKHNQENIRMSDLTIARALKRGSSN